MYCTGAFFKGMQSTMSCVHTLRRVFLVKHGLEYCSSTCGISCMHNINVCSCTLRFSVMYMLTLLFFVYVRVLFTASGPSSITIPRYCRTGGQNIRPAASTKDQAVYLYALFFELGYFLKPRRRSQLGSSERACPDLHAKGWGSNPTSPSHPCQVTIIGAIFQTTKK